MGPGTPPPRNTRGTARHPDGLKLRCEEGTGGEREEGKDGAGKAARWTDFIKVGSEYQACSLSKAMGSHGRCLSRRGTDQP